MMSESESHAVYFLKLQSITRFEVLRCIAHGSPDDEDGNDSDGLGREGEEAEQKPAPFPTTPSTSTPKSKPAVSTL